MPNSEHSLTERVAEIDQVFGTTTPINEEGLSMTESLDSFLAGLKPEANDGFDVLTGIYRCVVKQEEKAETGFIIKTWADGNESRQFQICADVVDVLQGNGNSGRRFWMRYNEDEKGLKRLINDLFTADLLDKVDRTSTEALKTTLPQIVGAVIYVRGWGWTKEGETEARQSSAIKSEKALKKLLAKSEASPF